MILYLYLLLPWYTYPPMAHNSPVQIVRCGRGSSLFRGNLSGQEIQTKNTGKVVARRVKEPIAVYTR